MMKKVIKATTGRSTSTEYIKCRLFDYLCDYMLDVDGYPAEQVVARVENLSPYFDIDDVIDLSYDEGITFTEALKQIEDELESM